MKKNPSITIYQREVRDYMDNREWTEYTFTESEYETIDYEDTGILCVAKDEAELAGEFRLKNGVHAQVEETITGELALFIDGVSRGFTAREVVLGVACDYGRFVRTE